MYYIYDVCWVKTGAGTDRCSFAHMAQDVAIVASLNVRPSRSAALTAISNLLT